MKILCLLSVAAIPCFHSCAQGTVFFANRLSAAIFAPVYGVDGVTPLSGANYSVQLYAGPDADSLAPAGSVATFRVGAGAGSWAGYDVTIRTAPPGTTAFLQARVWFNNGGTVPSYEQALAAGFLYGHSVIFQSLTMGGTNPPTPAPSTIGNPLAINNIQSFSLIPEPSALLLSFVGAATWLLRQRR